LQLGNGLFWCELRCTQNRQMQYCLTADELAQIEAELADVLQKVREADSQMCSTKEQKHRKTCMDKTNVATEWQVCDEATTKEH